MSSKNEIQSDALDAIKGKQKAGIEVSMGVGKTLLAIKHMASSHTGISKFLVIAPRLKIFQSWKDELVKHEYEYMMECIEYSTYLSLNKQDFDYDVVYLDECHNLKENHSEWLNHFENQGGVIIGMTGTYPVVSSSEKGKMCNRFCPKVYVYKTDDAVAAGILNDYNITVHYIDLNDKKTIAKKGKFGDYAISEKDEYNFWTKRIDDASTQKQEQIARITRMKKLQGFDSKEQYASQLFQLSNSKTIIFANTQKQADKLCEHSVHSKNKKSDENLEMFKDGTIDKLSAVEQLSEGVTIPELKTGIIMHAYGNNRKAAQKIGRLLRLNPEDKSNIHVLCYRYTIDEKWVESALSDFDESKIKWGNHGK
tara:strand:- start:3239 stop:4339 length:1101 start_codon:yes stop_codon:yes gene_type:complete